MAIKVVGGGVSHAAPAAVVLGVTLMMASCSDAESGVEGSLQPADQVESPDPAASGNVPGAGLGSLVADDQLAVEPAPEDTSAAQSSSTTSPEDANDSVEQSPPPTLGSPLELQLAGFGSAHLSFDAASTAAERLAPYADVVAPELYDALVQPVPAALQAQLVAEERRADAQFVSAEPLDSTATLRVYRLIFDVTESRAGVEPTTSSVQLVVSIGPDDVIEDVR